MSTPPFLSLPDRARALRLATDRGEFAALEARPVGWARGTALLVPGFTGSKEDFIAVLEPLTADGWRVVSTDLVGQHESPHAPGQRYDLAALAADVWAMIAALGDGSVHLLGHSFGGLVARAAVLGGDGTAAGIASLTLLCSGPAAVPEPGAGRLRLIVDALARVDLATIWAIMRQLDTENGVPTPPPAVDAFLERRFLANDPASLRRFAEQLLAEPDRVDELGRVLRGQGAAALVAHGVDDDAWTAASQKEMAARLGAGYEVLAGAAHSPAAEAPAATAALLSGFWAAGGPGG